MAQDPTADPELGGESHEKEKLPTLKQADAKSRVAFIRKVYLILAIQLIITSIMAAAVFWIKFVNDFFHEHALLLLIISFIGVIISSLILICIPSVARWFPINYVCLTIFTACESVLVACITSTYPSDEVLLAFSICAIICVALTLFAWQTTIDFTLFNGMLFIGFLLLMLLGIVSMFIRIKLLHTIFVFGVCFLFSIYIIIDTQMIIGSKSAKFMEDDYILAAFVLYMDIIILFLYILSLIGNRLSSRSIFAADAS